MKKAYIKKLMISGISITTNNENENNEDTQKIASLWEKYDVDNMYTKTLNKAKNNSFYGLYSNYASDENGDYEATVGVEVTKTKNNAIVIENAKYLLFAKEGEVPEVSFELWQEIGEYFENNNEYERAYAVDFEKYSKENEVEIYISIK
jgi:predicted transcriptional regulator YdeE